MTDQFNAHECYRMAQEATDKLFDSEKELERIKGLIKESALRGETSAQMAIATKSSIGACKIANTLSKLGFVVKYIGLLRGCPVLDVDWAGAIVTVSWTVGDDAKESK